MPSDGDTSFHVINQSRFEYRIINNFPPGVALLNEIVLFEFNQAVLNAPLGTQSMFNEERMPASLWRWAGGAVSDTWSSL